MEEVVRTHIFVSGRVQGVFYRKSAQDKARELGVTGWAQNISDGRVEVVCEGERNKVEQFVEWCKEGPPLASVENVEIEYEDVQNEFQDFEVK